MKKSLTEKQALQKLNILSFADLPYEKLELFSKILPKMEPDVAKKALEQIPEFTKSAVQIANYNKELFSKGIDSQDASTQMVLTICNNIVQVYEEKLNDSISPKERSECIKNLLEIAKISSEINKSHQKGISKIVLIIAISAVAILCLPLIALILVVALFFLPVAIILGIVAILFVSSNKTKDT